ncbi:MAG TPA: chemotaxis protein CheA [Polyangiales bacterium]|nr:chemotaxis protein CheA [Polyangiales bacterium]
MAQGKDGERAREEFLAEAQELIETLSRDLLILDEGQKSGARNPEALNDLFRGVHTLKGLSGMFGFERLGRMSHILEDLLEDLRLGRIEMSQQVLDVLFEGIESFSRLLTDTGNEAVVDIEAFSERVRGLTRARAATHNILEDYDFDPNMLGVLTEYEEHRLRTNLEQGFVVFRLRIRLALDLIDTALDQLKERMKSIAEIITYLPSMEGAGGDSIEIEMLLATKKSDIELRAALNRPEASLSAVLKKKTPYETPSAREPSIIPERKPDQPRTQEPQAPAIEAQPKRPAMTEQNAEISLRSLTSVVRVDIRKLDHLMNVVGELGTVRASLARLLDRMRATAPQSISSEVHRIHRAFQRHLAEVQDGVLDIRMVPLAQLFDKVAVIVRQVAREQKKEVRLLITGAETEVDKLIAEELADPMMHIVRNAIDHGVEPSTVRSGIGKPPVATLAVNAYQKGNHVVIELSDDGRGIDPNMIREAAVRKGLMTEQAASDLTREELLNVIFLPGFSTANQITDISGRGVGMDVVKTNITRLGGAVDIESEVSVGTKVTITLPITLAIISALLFEVRGKLFAIPLAVVQEALRLPLSALRTVEGREVVTLHGTTLPLCRLAQLFRLGALPEGATEHYVIVITVGNRRIGLCVERLAGQQDIVIKGLGRSLTGVQGISGATDLGDQRLVLVLDAASIIEEVLVGRSSALVAGGMQ